MCASKVFADLSLARFYKWHQSDRHIYLAVYVPNGTAERPLTVQVDAQVLSVGVKGGPEVLHRFLVQPLDHKAPIDTFWTPDNRLAALVLPKQEPGRHWSKLFSGDTDGYRSMVPPYRMCDTPDEVTLEFRDLPFWIDSDDVRVKISGSGVRVAVRNQLMVERSFWKDPERKADSIEVSQK